jgi:hypothetical protein
MPSRLGAHDQFLDLTVQLRKNLEIDDLITFCKP